MRLGAVAYDDTARVVTEYDGEGVVISSRPYTAEENAAADAAAGLSAASVNESTLRADAAAQIDVLLASIATLQVVTDKSNNAIGGADTKTVARECRRVARQLVRITRLLVGALDTADAGPE